MLRQFLAAPAGMIQFICISLTRYYDYGSSVYIKVKLFSRTRKKPCSITQGNVEIIIIRSIDRTHLRSIRSVNTHVKILGDLSPCTCILHAKDRYQQYDKRSHDDLIKTFLYKCHYFIRPLHPSHLPYLYYLPHLFHLSLLPYSRYHRSLYR